jgi:peptide/nickel transport system substrate-binding protein
MLAALVASGDLPPVEERLPKEPLVLPVVERVGDYGGTWRRFFTGPNDNENINRLTPDHILMWDTNGVDLYPNIVKGFELSSDEKVVTLHLREGMKWSDGAPFTAADFEFAYNDVSNNDELRPGYGGKMGGSIHTPRFEKIDDYTIRYIFDQPSPAFLDDLANPFAVGEIRIFSQGGGSIAYPAHYMKQFHIDYGDKAAIEKMVKDGGFESWATLFLDKAHPNRNPDFPIVGPWMTTVPNTEATFELERNPYYWAVDEAGNQLPYIDRIVMQLATDLEVIALKAMRGETDYQRRHIGLDKLPLLVASQDVGNYRVQLTDHPAGSGLTWNLTWSDDPFMEKLINTTEFRQALAIATNREAFMEAFFQGMGYIRNMSPLPTHPFYLGEEYDTMWNYLDVAKANQMLDDIGLEARDSNNFRLRPDGNGPINVEVACITAYFADWCGMTDLLRAQWAENVGIKVTANPMDVSLFGERRDDNKNMTFMYNIPAFLALAPYCVRTIGCDVAPAVGKWYNTNGAEGVEPTGVLKLLGDVEEETFRLRVADRKDWYQKGFRAQIEQALGITLNHAAPGFMGVLVVKNNFRNTPLGVPDISHIPVEQRTDQWFFAGGKNDAGY